MGGRLGRSSSKTVRILAFAVALRALLLRLLNYLIPIASVDVAGPRADLRILLRNSIDGILQALTFGLLLISIFQFSKNSANDISAPWNNFGLLLAAGLLVLVLALSDSNDFLFDYVGPTVVPLLVGAAASCASNVKRRP